ncbi:hypothetical protein K7432_005066 [Basidiobolus ranarum]|uniref:DUF7082 domain-containing protein n=1 Tax=Basidiobolus ranarum TaxID=34480 RepID=A0ABR2WXA3_9FUNG
MMLNTNFTARTPSPAESNQPRNIPRPRVLQYYPRGGLEGMPFTVVLQFCPKEQLKLGFGTHVVNTKQWNAHGYTTLTASIPEFVETKWFTPKVPVCILAVEQGIVLDSWYFGEYTYKDDLLLNQNSSLDSNFGSNEIYTRESNQMSNTIQNSIQNSMDTYQNTIESMLTSNFQDSISNMMSKPISSGFPNTLPTPKSVSKPKENELTPLSEEQDFKFTFGSDNMSMKGSNLSIVPVDIIRNDFNDLSQDSSLFSSQNSQRQMHEAYNRETESNNVSNVDLTPPLTPVSAQSAQSSQMTYSTSPPVQNPYSSPNNSTKASGAATSFNSSPPMLNKATLKFSNEFEEMTKNWCNEETEIRRRLVQFWRKHENNVIHCGFQGVSPSDRAPNSIVVSCIYWEAKNDYFITSVDCIYLLESLIAVRFTVEEKNRIRRNLEGFRPLTVSKCKSESADFFKLIMSFPNPKPRNIEKDVKVFPWKVLPLALKKIIGKYTASSNNSSNVNTDAFHNTFAPNYAAEVKNSSCNLSSPGPEGNSSSIGQDIGLTSSPSVSPTLNHGNYASQSNQNEQLTGANRRQHSFLRRHSLVGPYSVSNEHSASPSESKRNIEQSHNLLVSQISLQPSIGPEAMITFGNNEVKVEPSFEEVLNGSFDVQANYSMPSYQESTWMLSGNGAITIPHSTSPNAFSGVNMGNGFVSLCHPSFMMSNSRI